VAESVKLTDARDDLFLGQALVLTDAGVVNARGLYGRFPGAVIVTRGTHQPELFPLNRAVVQRPTCPVQLEDL
jgi:hypothetical protein